jgi:hypothetical protein
MVPTVRCQHPWECGKSCSPAGKRSEPARTRCGCLINSAPPKPSQPDEIRRDRPAALRHDAPLNSRSCFFRYSAMPALPQQSKQQAHATHRRRPELSSGELSRRNFLFGDSSQPPGRGVCRRPAGPPGVGLPAGLRPGTQSGGVHLGLLETSRAA